MAEIDDAIRRNLDSQHRRLAAIEEHLDQLLAGETTPADLPVPPARPETYESLTATNDALRAEHGWGRIDLDDALTDQALAEFELWRRRRRTRWQLDDILAVAVAGAVGIAATWFDTSIDAVVRDRLKALSDSPLIRRWERAAKGLPIDFTGKGFGGPLHRVRSAGHDIGRPFEALRQIREGRFHGFTWDHGERTEFITDNLRGHRYEPVTNLPEALTLWGKHLVADFVTVTSLPLPGWTRLYEQDNRILRTFAHQAYGSGANLRSFSVSTLPVMTTEITVRTHVHGRAMLTTGSAVLRPSETALRAELLLAGHALVGATSLGKTLTTSIAATPASGFRHINWPVLMRAATTSLDVVRDARARRSTAAGWDDLLSDLAGPWQLDEATAAEEAFDAKQDVE